MREVDHLQRGRALDHLAADDDYGDEEDRGPFDSLTDAQFNTIVLVEETAVLTEPCALICAKNDLSIRI
ncbi:MAG: hypothetical protein D8M59_01835 [Planctomycetes bacterium]|nr:hypothetical protein [Planctomycetota bacterium]NOG54541.1 hypothetical protein [Planctomycetota bacterium]